jgi:hypothetical protein
MQRKLYYVVDVGDSDSDKHKHIAHRRQRQKQKIEKLNALCTSIFDVDKTQSTTIKYTVMVG